MLRSTQRILTTHTGSLPRPEGLTQLYIDRGQGKHVDQSRSWPAQAGRPPTAAFEGRPTPGSTSATTASSRETRSSCICVIG